MPTVTVNGVGDIEFPDSMSLPEIKSAIEEKFGPPPQEEHLTTFGSVVRAEKNAINSVIDIAAAIPDSAAIIANKIGETFQSPEDRVPFENLKTHQAAEWIRSFELSHGDQQRPEGVQGFLTDTVPSMAGAAVGLMAPAAALERYIPEVITAGFGGAAMQGVNAFREARQAGATEDQQFQSWLVNAGIGSAAAIPVSRWLNAQPSKDLLAMALKEGSINAAVGFFQQLASNGAARGIYDPNRPWLTGTGEAVAGGLTIGGLMGLAMAGLAKPKQNGQKTTATIADTELKASATVAETTNAPDTAQALVELDAQRAQPKPATNEQLLLDAPSFTVEEQTRAILDAEAAKRAELEAQQELLAKPTEEITKATEAQPEQAKLSESEKSSLQDELNAELGVDESAPAPSKPDYQHDITGREVPIDSYPLVERVRSLVDEVNQKFGKIFDRVVIQDIPEGAGISSAARTGEHGALVLDPVRLAESERSGAPLKDLIHEEMVHALQGKSIHDMWEKLGSPGEYRDYFDKTYSDIANEMTPQQKEWIQKLYGTELKSPVQMAAEYVRALLQEKYTGKTSEAGYNRSKQPLFTNLLKLFKQFWGGSKNKKGEIGALARKQIVAIDKLLSEGNKNARRSKQSTKQPESNPAEVPESNGGTALLPDVSPNRSDTPTATVESNAGEPGTTGSARVEAGSDGSEAKPKPAVVDIPDSHQEAIYEAAQDIVKNKGLDGVNEELAFDFVFERLSQRANKYQAEHGSLDGFATKRVADGLLKDFYRYKSAKVRSGETVSLDNPMGMEDGDATFADVIGEGDVTKVQSNERNAMVELYQEASKDLPKETKQLLEALLKGHGGIAELAKQTGIPESTLRNRAKIAQKELARAVLDLERGREFFDPSDLLNAADPVDNPLEPRPDVPLARWLSPAVRFKRFFSPSRFGYGGVLTDVANTTTDPTARGLVMKLAKLIPQYYDTVQNINAKATTPFFDVLNRVTKAEETKLRNEFELFWATHESRDGGKSAAQSQNEAMTQIYPTLSPKAKALVDASKRFGVGSGQLMQSLNGGLGHFVKEGKNYRNFQDLGENYFGRRFSQEVDMVLSDPDATPNRARFMQLMEELVANNPKQFENVEAAIKYWTESGVSSISDGSYNAGVDMARGVKMPDSWHDYSLDGYLRSLENWSTRIAQIHTFGDNVPAEVKGGNVIRPELIDAFEEAIRFGTRQSNGTGEPGLKKILTQIKEDTLGIRQSHQGDEWVRRLRSLGTIRYLSAVLSSVRNVGQAIVATSEHAGMRNTLIASSKALYDAARAVGQSIKSGKLIEPKAVEDAARIGAFQRSLSHQSFYDLDPIKPAATAIGKAYQYVGEKLLLGQHLSEGWNRGMSASAFSMWARDAVRAFAHDPGSREVAIATANLQRWGFSQAERQRFFSGDASMVNKLIRVAVKEKNYGYKGDQVPAIFRSPGFQLLTLFQSWGIQRTRDFARNVWRPMFHGDTVAMPDGSTRNVRDIMPMIRFIVGSTAGAAALNWLKDEALGRKLRDPSWQEIFSNPDDDKTKAAMMALSRMFKDVTMSGGAGLIPDYMRSTMDWTTQGRNKSLANSPALQFASDLTDFIKNQVGREGDPRAFWRDFRDTILLRTPLLKEGNDMATHFMLFGEDQKALFDSRQTISVGRAMMKRWLTESGRDNLIKKHSFTGDKTPNSETYDQINESLLEGDTVRAGQLVNEYTNNRRDRKKLSAVQASIRGRTPLAGEARLTPEDMRQFIEWAKQRNPQEGEKLDELLKGYKRATNRIGFR